MNDTNKLMDDIYASTEKLNWKYEDKINELLDAKRSFIINRIEFVLEDYRCKVFNNGEMQYLVIEYLYQGISRAFFATFDKISEKIGEMNEFINNRKNDIEKMEIAIKSVAPEIESIKVNQYLIDSAVNEFINKIKNDYRMQNFKDYIDIMNALKHSVNRDTNELFFDFTKLINSYKKDLLQIYFEARLKAHKLDIQTEEDADIEKTNEMIASQSRLNNQNEDVTYKTNEEYEENQELSKDSSEETTIASKLKETTEEAKQDINQRKTVKVFVNRHNPNQIKQHTNITKEEANSYAEVFGYKILNTDGKLKCYSNDVYNGDVILENNGFSIKDKDIKIYLENGTYHAICYSNVYSYNKENKIFIQNNIKFNLNSPYEIININNNNLSYTDEEKFCLLDKIKINFDGIWSDIEQNPELISKYEEYKKAFYKKYMFFDETNKLNEDLAEDYARQMHQFGYEVEDIENPLSIKCPDKVKRNFNVSGLVLHTDNSFIILNEIPIVDGKILPERFSKVKNPDSELTFSGNKALLHDLISNHEYTVLFDEITGLHFAVDNQEVENNQEVIYAFLKYYPNVLLEVYDRASKVKTNKQYFDELKGQFR